MPKIQTTPETAFPILIMKAAESIFPADTLLLKEGKMQLLKFSTDSTDNFQSLLSDGRHTEYSFFKTHQLKPGGFHPVTFKKYQPDWILGILLLGFILVAWVQVFYRRRIRQVLMAPYSRRFLSQLVRDGDLLSERISLALGFLYFLTASLLLYQSYDLLIMNKIVSFPEGALVYALIVAGLSGFWILKIGLIRFLSFIFRTRQATNEYVLNIFIFNMITGVFLLPMLVFVVYLKSPFFLWTGVGIFILFFIFRIIRGFLIGISIPKFPHVFLFVYLCSLEILPLVILVKVLFSCIF
ncbi:MAG: DUF4271 domain-containing protein [Bacteroidetes bacterium]|nr:DUF4271 domain-containing protein [Bacteroidota bacterium]